MRHIATAVQHIINTHHKYLKWFVTIVSALFLAACGSEGETDIPGGSTSSSSSSSSSNGSSSSTSSTSSSGHSSSSSSSGHSSCEASDCNGTGQFRYGEALQKSWYFYEAQQAGELPDWNRVSWRGNATPEDGDDHGVDLRGGWFDAGDHVKFGFPMAASATLLAWGAVDYREAYVRSNQLPHMLNNLRFINDYFIAAHSAPYELFGQVGLGSRDHSWWGSPEVMHHEIGLAERPSFKIDLSCPGVDLAAETAAAMAASSMVFAPDDQAYSLTLLEHARQLYEFAEITVGSDGKDNAYSNCITDAQTFYNANHGVYWDELAWGATWLYRATGDAAYLSTAKNYYGKMGREQQSDIPVYRWTQGWNDKAFGVYALLAALEPETARYSEDVERWLDYWSTGDGRRSPSGLIVVDVWGVLRYASNTAFVALYYADQLPAGHPKKAQYHTFAKRQIDYALGDNPRNSSYVIGFGNNPPQNPHHRGAHGSWWDSSSVPEKTRHILYGALVGGPTDDITYEDDRDNYIDNEVATDYNAGFTSALAALYALYGGEPLADTVFPPKSIPDKDQWVVGVQRNNGSNSRIGLKVVVQNHTGYPAQALDNLKIRYFVDISELIAEGLSASDVTAELNYTQHAGAVISALKPWNIAQNLYYVEIDVSGAVIYPGGQSQHRTEVQFVLSVPDATKVYWVNENDPSWLEEYSTTDEDWGAPSNSVPIYSGEVHLYGDEPEGGLAGAQ